METLKLQTDRIEIMSMFNTHISYEITLSCLRHATALLGLETGYMVAELFPHDSSHLVPWFGGYACQHFKRWARVKAPASLPHFQNWDLLGGETDDDSEFSPAQKRRICMRFD